jgi:GNAT superfamily N-acetyltransferase
VRVATAADYDAVLATIVGAFYEDPLWSWMFPDPRRRADQHATVFGLYVECALPNGGVWMSDRRASAAAVFTPPGLAELTDEATGRLDAFIRDQLGDHAAPVLETLERFEAAIPDAPAFYYLSLLGTHPKSRGRGIGMGLLSELAARADQEGVPIYLESTNPANTPRYERLRFRGQSTFSTPDELHKVTTMWREPCVTGSHL